ncbi:MAG: hypothetical protein QMD96_01880 [Anaerosomatales bacterium]|nr:hypothetical protein [Anaerosomatales bacterium]
MARARSFITGVLVQAAFTFAGLVVTRWSFRSCPTGAYTVVPSLIGIAGIAVVVGLAYWLAVRGLPLPLVVAAWVAGRIAGALLGAVLPGVGIDAALLAQASFGVLALEGRRVAFGAPSLTPLLVQLTVLALAWLAGSRLGAGIREH